MGGLRAARAFGISESALFLLEELGVVKMFQENEEILPETLE